MQITGITQSFAAALIFAGLAGVVPAFADVIYTNLGNGGSYNNNDLDIVFGGGSLRESFQVGSNSKFTDAQLPVVAAEGDSSITVTLAADNGGSPGTVLDTLAQQGSLPYNPELVSFRCSACPTLFAGRTYWIVASTSNSFGWYFNNTGVGRFALQVNGIAVCSSRSLPLGQWTMFSLPCAVTGPSTVSTVFTGISGAYDTDWVVWERDEATNQYVKLGLNSQLTQGNGYWFRSLNPATFSVSVPASATPTSNGYFEIPLIKPASSNGLYNLAGHPFPYSVNWSDVRVVVNGAGGVSPSQAESAGKLSKTFWSWSGSSYDSYDDVTPALIGQLQATYGMWVKVLDPNLDSIKLLIPAAAGQTGQAAVIKQGQLKPAEWYVRLIAEAPAEGLKDRGNVLGQLKDSKVGRDSHDLPELAPSFTPYLTVVFPGEYASDFHPLKAGADAWNFVVRTDNPARQVKLSWEVSGKAPGSMSLKDMKTGRVTALQAGNYTFVMGAKERAFVWTVK